MVELRWIKMFLFLILGLQFTAVTGQTSLYITVRDGNEATLSCKNVMTDQDKCDRTDWLFSHSINTPVVELIRLGQIDERAKAKSDRLSVTANCSLVIKKVTVEDAGQYTCRQDDRPGQQYKDSLVHLSVVIMTEHKDNDEVTLSCSVSIYDGCRHTVKWLLRGGDLDINTRTIKTSQSTCSVTALLLTSHYIYESNYKYLQCEVTNGNNRKVQLYNFSPQLSSKKPGEAATTTTREPETTAAEKGPDGKGKAPTTKSPTEKPETSEASKDGSALIYTMLVMRVVELILITVVAVLITVVAVRHFRARAGNQRPPDDHTVSYSVRSRTARRSGAAASQEMNDEDDGAVNYEN